MFYVTHSPSTFTSNSAPLPGPGEHDQWFCGYVREATRATPEHLHKLHREKTGDPGLVLVGDSWERRIGSKNKWKVS
jgi:hypothetical protein